MVKEVIGMKKSLSALLILVLLTVAETGCTAASSKKSTAVLTVSMQIGNPIMTVNGMEKEIDPGMGTAPVLQNGRTLLPIRAVMEELGGAVTWDEETQTVVLAMGNSVILLTIDSPTAYLNEEAVVLDTPPVVMNGRTMLPIRFIAESFGIKVGWDESTSTVTLTKEGREAGEQPNQAVSDEKERTLVAYFSRSGNTQALAETVHQTAGGDLVEIVPVNPYPEDYNECLSQARQEQASDFRSEITVELPSLEPYDTIILGYPIWFGTLPPPVVTFLGSYDFSGKTVMPFCTSGSSGIGGSLAKIRQLCPNSTVTDGFRGTSSTKVSEIQMWLDENGFLGTNEAK